MLLNLDLYDNLLSFQWSIMVIWSGLVDYWWQCFSLSLNESTVLLAVLSSLFSSFHSGIKNSWKCVRTWCRLANMFIDGWPREATFTLCSGTQPTKALVGLLAGHTMINRHHTIMKIRTDPLYSACGEEEKTPHTTVWEKVLLECWIEKNVCFWIIPAGAWWV